MYWWEYDILAKELSRIYKFETIIITHVQRWVKIVTKYHKVYMNKLQKQPEAKEYPKTTTTH